MNEIIDFWNGLSPLTKTMIFDMGKLGLLIIISLAFVEKLREWFVHFNLDEMFKLPTIDKNKRTISTTWLSTSLAFVICVSIAIVIVDQLIFLSFLTAKQSSMLFFYWGLFLSYLLLIYFLKQILLTFKELLTHSRLYNYIDEYLVNSDQTRTSNQSESSADVIVHNIILILYIGIAWVIGFVLLIESFNLGLLSRLAQSLFFSVGELMVALLMLTLGIKFYTFQKQTDNLTLDENKSTVVMIGCMIFGALLIGGSASSFSLLPWLFILVLTGYFLIKYEASFFSDLVAGLFLRLNRTFLFEENEQNFRIVKLGMLASEISDTSGKKEILHNSKLLSISSGKSTK